MHSLVSPLDVSMSIVLILFPDKFNVPRSVSPLNVSISIVLIMLPDKSYICIQSFHVNRFDTIS